MKYLAPLLVLFGLLEFTTPNGFAIFINKDQVVAVTHPNGECIIGTNTRVITTKGDTCVRETVVQKLEGRP